jgi:hypothetical protein
VLKKLVTSISLVCGLAVNAVSDAPFTKINPSLEAVGLYAFTSYEPGREEFITIIANYNSQQSSGPIYNLFDPDALYEIKIDNNGNGRENISFRFRFNQELKKPRGQVVSVSDKQIAIPFINNGSFTSIDTENLGRSLSYQVEFLRRRQTFNYGKTFNVINSGNFIRNTISNNRNFQFPESNIGTNSINDYEAYLNDHIYSVKLPFKRCTEEAKIFAGPRKEIFAANFSGVHDLINTNLLQAENSQINEFENNTVLSIALELPKSCLDINNDNPVIGIWTSVSVPARQIFRNRPSYNRQKLVTQRDYVQVSRLGNPLVNKFLIGLPDKDRFNSSRPQNDRNSRYENYILYPALAKLIDESSASITAPNLFPRTDLEDFFLAGIENLNRLSTKKGGNARKAEYLRLNTSTVATARGSQARLGVLANDNAGYPNGRRPGDDVVDIFYRVLMGARISDINIAPSKDAVLTDGVLTSDLEFLGVFPYL